MTTQMWVAILSSSLLSAAIAGFFALRAKQRDYVDDYFRKVLDRRLSAYALIETLIFNFKISSPNSNGLLFHHVFNTGESEDPGHISMLFFRLDAEAFWLSDDIFQKSREVSNLLIQRPASVSWIDFGTSHYKEFASIRVGLERLYARDLRTLHKVPRFLKSKRHIDELEEILISRSNLMQPPKGD
jgi:hypothetical protein